MRFPVVMFDEYNPTQSAIAHNPFRSALRAGKNIQRPAKSAEA